MCPFPWTATAPSCPPPACDAGPALRGALCPCVESERLSVTAGLCLFINQGNKICPVTCLWAQEDLYQRSVCKEPDREPFPSEEKALVDQEREKSHAVSFSLICVREVENQISQLSAEPVPSVPSPLSGAAPLWQK